MIIGYRTTSQNFNNDHSISINFRVVVSIHMARPVCMYITESINNNKSDPF